MDNRNFQSGASASAPVAPAAPSNGFPSNGNPATGTPATQPGAHWFHKIGEELRAVVTGAGITPTDGDLLQVSKAIQSGGLWSGVSGGTADVITATFTPGIVALTNGMSLNVRASFVNATTAPTFTPNSGTIAAKGIVKGNGLALVAGDIAGAGHWLMLQYDATLAKWVLLNPAKGVIIADSIPVGTIITQAKAGTALTGYLQCPLVLTTQLISDFPALAAVLGTSWGGNGTTTFGLPYFAADQVPVAAGAGVVGSHTDGVVLAHTHTYNATGVGSGNTLGGFAGGQAYNSTTTSSTGGTANLAAGNRVNFWVKY